MEEFGRARFTQPDHGLALYVPGDGGGDGAFGGSLDFRLCAPDLEVVRDRVAQVTDTTTLHENADGSRSLEFEDPDRNVLKIMGATP